MLTTMKLAHTGLLRRVPKRYETTANIAFSDRRGYIALHYFKVI